MHQQSCINQLSYLRGQFHQPHSVQQMIPFAIMVINLINRVDVISLSYSVLLFAFQEDQHGNFQEQHLNANEADEPPAEKKIKFNDEWSKPQMDFGMFEKTHLIKKRTCSLQRRLPCTTVSMRNDQPDCNEHVLKVFTDALLTRISP